MKKLIFFLQSSFLIFFLLTISGNKLIKDGKSYKFSKYQVLTNSEAVLFKRSRTNRTISNVFAILGYGLARIVSTPSEYKATFYGTTTTVKNDKGAYWACAGVGAVLVGIGIPFAVSAKNNAENAVALENGEGLLNLFSNLKVLELVLL
jgi:hypothetical protein